MFCAGTEEPAKPVRRSYPFVLRRTAGKLGSNHADFFIGTDPNPAGTAAPVIEKSAENSGSSLRQPPTGYDSY